MPSSGATGVIGRQLGIGWRGGGSLPEPGDGSAGPLGVLPVLDGRPSRSARQTAVPGHDGQQRAPDVTRLRLAAVPAATVSVGDKVPLQLGLNVPQTI